MTNAQAQLSKTLSLHQSTLTHLSSTQSNLAREIECLKEDTVRKQFLSDYQDSVTQQFTQVNTDLDSI